MRAPSVGGHQLKSNCIHSTIAVEKKLDDGNETAAAASDELNDQKILMRMMICSRTKIYQKVFVGTHFLILIFDFKLKGLSKMKDRFCEGKKISSSTAQQQQAPPLLVLIFDLLIKQD